METPMKLRKPWFLWTVQKEERLVELWSEQECLCDVSSHLYHDRVEKEKKWTEIAAALEIPSEYTIPN